MINIILFLVAVILFLIICFGTFTFYSAIKMNKKISKEMAETDRILKERREEFNKQFLTQKRNFENSRVKKFFDERDRQEDKND